MLPAYLSYFTGTGDETGLSRPAALRRALVVGAVMSLSFLLIFGVTGIAITAGFRAVIDWIPYIALAVGALVALLGIAMVFGCELKVRLPRAQAASKSRDHRSVFLFGLSYEAASLSCTLPVFLSVAAAQLTATSFVSGAATFLVYALGMSMMVMALGKQTIVNHLRRSARYINRASGVILVLAGAYIVWLWATNLGQGAGALNDSSAFRFTESLSSRTTELFGENALLWALVFGGLIVSVDAYAFRPDAGVGRARRSAFAAATAAGMLAAVVGAGIFAASPLTGSGGSETAAGAAAPGVAGPRARRLRSSRASTARRRRWPMSLNKRILIAPPAGRRGCSPG